MSTGTVTLDTTTSNELDQNSESDTELEAPPQFKVGFDENAKWKRERNFKTEETELVSSAQEWRAVVASPFTWQVCAAFPHNDITEPTGGRKRDYPDWLMFFLVIGMPMFGGSERSTIAALADPAEWDRFVRHVHPYLPDGWTSPLTGFPKSSGKQDAADRLAGTRMPPPKRHHLTYFLLCWRGVPTKGKKPPKGIANVRRELMKAFRLAAMAQALQDGRFPAEGRVRLTSPDPRSSVNFDGTVFALRRTPSSTTEDPGMDTDNGAWITGSGDEVYGSKFVFASTRTTNYKSRLILDLQHVPYSPTAEPVKYNNDDTDDTDDFKGEQKAVLDILNRALPHAPGIRVVTCDSALRGLGVAAVQALGPVVVNDPHVKTKADPDKNIEEEVKTQLVTVLKGRACQHRIMYVHGSPHEHTIDMNGKSILRALHIDEYERHRNPNGTYRHYHILCVPCPDGDHHPRIALFHNPTTNGLTFNRGEYIRVIPPGSDLHNAWYGMRNDTEALHSELKDRHVHVSRRSVPQQQLTFLAYAVGQNAVAYAFARQSAHQPNALDNTA